MDETEKIQVLSDLVAINTANNNEKEVAEYLQNLFSNHGIKSKMIKYSDTRYNLVAEIGSGKPVLAVSGHMDTVDTGDTTQWNTDPHKLTEKDGNLYGLGAVDMKSGLSALVIAMIELHENNQPTSGTVRLLATIAEEVGEYGADQLTSEGYMDDADALLIGEPGGYNFVYTHMGSLDLKVTSEGKAAHSSMPDSGNNAIDHLLNFLSQANSQFKNTGKSDPVMGNFIFNVTTIKGGTQVNAIPGHAEAEINSRTLPQYTSDQVLNDIRLLVDKLNSENNDYHLNIKVIMKLNPVKAAKDSKLLKISRQVAKEHTGLDVGKYGIAGTTDAAMFLRDKPDDFAFVMFGPGNDTPHQVNEYVNKEMYLKFIDMYKDIFVKYL
ncbi:ArgE/DapE family deacylase [Companilactobacillus jidongensis]|uniref:ArgE/DapE family deacylase n=1 Tax=Companilactobacillus jidongensis TaxID=2486006 RepID=UPI000F767E0B|nr:ArgE/DapE family deacylase [Companilactobacillus jidongensis]